MSKTTAYLAAARGMAKNRKPLIIGGIVLVGGIGLFSYGLMSARRRAYKLAADGNVNALAAQAAGEMLPTIWKNSNIYLRHLMPPGFFRAAKEVQEFFKSETFKTKIFKVTETVTDPKEFEWAFRAMWGFSFMNTLEQNMSPADSLRILESLRREKVRAGLAPKIKGLYMVSKTVLVPKDVAVIINGSVFTVNQNISPGMVLGLADGNSIAKGSIKEGYTSKVKYGTTTATVVADKSKVQFLTASQVQSRNLKSVPVSYIKK